MRVGYERSVFESVGLIEYVFYLHIDNQLAGRAIVHLTIPSSAVPHAVIERIDANLKTVWYGDLSKDLIADFSEMLKEMNYPRKEVCGEIAVLHQIEIYHPHKGKGHFSAFFGEVMNAAIGEGAKHVILEPEPYLVRDKRSSVYTTESKRLEKIYKLSGFSYLGATGGTLSKIMVRPLV